MTREEAIEKLELMRQKVDEETYRALILAIKALERMPEVTSTMQTGQFVYVKEPCDDAISREDALNCLNGAWGDYSVLNEVYERISKLPSVTQKGDVKNV